IAGSTIEMGSDIKLSGFGIGGGQGGSFLINAGRLEIAPGDSSWVDAGRVEVAGTSAGALIFHPRLFFDFRFSSFDLRASGPRSLVGSDIDNVAAIRTGAAIDVVPRTIILNDGYAAQANNDNVMQIARVSLLDQALRPATNFSLSAAPKSIGGPTHVG